jgi:heterodisulfide reductase subunit A
MPVPFGRHSRPGCNAAFRRYFAKKADKNLKKGDRKMLIQQIHQSSNLGDVMVVGGGISGIQAALDLATAGFKVFLVEKSPAIGGHMAQLDKTFPTNDCSMCIESPKFIECNRHPNIEILTYTEVERVEGEAGDFKVTLLKKPRYVIESKCTGCTTCVEYCPVRYPDQFNQELSKNKAIHIYFAQAVPLVTYIDESCLYLKEKKCRVCEAVCKNGAIDFTQTPKKVEIKVGAVVLAPGYEPVDPRKLRDSYGYGKFANVVTSLDYERLLCATGPYEGEIRRPSDRKIPRKIAWIHCVGSRQVTPGGNSYCSAVCCTYTQKQVILTKDHDPEAECTIFHNDIRSYGKDFERFYQRAANLPGVRFIRSYVTIEREIPESKNVTIRYSTPEEGVKEEEFEMVVLSVGLNPPADFQSLADKFGIELNAQGFCKTDPVNPMKTSRPGIFVSGAFQGPLDIPEAVVTASGAGSQCGELLAYRRGKLARKRIYRPERDVSEEEPRVGVYVCHCGANIGRVVDVPSVVDYALNLPHVVHAEENLFICSTEAAQRIAESIREKRLNRVVVAACTPRTHEPLFRDTLREGGINQYFFDMANIREHCSWVHAKEKEEATRKAKDLIRMSVGRSLYLEPLQELELPVHKAALVVGGGIAGMTCALSIASQGHEVHLVEKEKDLGGTARRIYYTLEGMDVQAYLHELIRKVYQHPLIRVHTGAVITESTGYVGNFLTRVESAGKVTEIKHGATVIATGAREYKPAEYLYGKDDRVMTNLELEEQIAKGKEKVLNAKCLVMIQCVGCRQEDRNYCSRVCCSHSVKNALKLKEINPGMDIYILFRDMRTYGFREDYYRKAAGKEIRFIRYEPPAKPLVEAVEDEEGRCALRVTVADSVLGKRLEIEADLVALAAAVLPPADRKEIAGLFKVSLSPDGFFQEAHVKLRPVDFAAEGVYLCGMAHYPKHIPEAINQAYGAAGRALTLLVNDTVTVPGSVCEVNERKCIGCEACISACKYGAIKFQETRQGQKAAVNPVLCKGDGLCNTKCPTGAISLKHYTDEQIFHQIDALFADVDKQLPI